MQHVNVCLQALLKRLGKGMQRAGGREWQVYGGKQWKRETEMEKESLCSV